MMLTKVGGMEKPLDEYSTTETVIGKWIDGKPIYRKVVNCGVLPNSASTKKIPHGIVSLDKAINLHGFAVRTSDNAQIPMPYILDNTGHIPVFIDETNITIITFANRADFVAYMIVEYTKV